MIRHRVDGLWLSARIIETEAYYQAEKGSHASLGYTHKRRALFMDGGVIYMYYARGGDSLNFSAAGPGNAVLIKSGHPWVDARSGPEALARMQALNPDAAGRASAAQAVRRPDAAVPRPGLESAGLGCAPLRPRGAVRGGRGRASSALVRCARLGIPAGRDEHLQYRYVDPAYAAFCTRNPLRRGQVAGRDYVWVDGRDRELPPPGGA